MVNRKLARRQTGKMLVYTIIIVLIIFFIWMLILQAKGLGPQINKQVEKNEEFELLIIEKAKDFYIEKKNLNMDFSNGPCLTNELETDWVLDLVHNPHQPQDDLSQNQCPAFLLGEAHHFVELDLNGEFVRLK